MHGIQHAQEVHRSSSVYKEQQGLICRLYEHRKVLYTELSNLAINDYNLSVSIDLQHVEDAIKAFELAQHLSAHFEPQNTRSIWDEDWDRPSQEMWD